MPTADTSESVLEHLHRLVRTISGNPGTSITQPVSSILSSETIPARSDVRDDNPTLDAAAEPPISSQSVFSFDIMERFKRLDLGEKFRRTKDLHEDYGQPEVGTSQHVEPSSSLSPEATISPGTETTTASGTSNEDLSEPTYIARKIRALIDSLPFHSAPALSDAPAPSPECNATGNSILPTDAIPEEHSRLVAMLSSPAVMNGSSSSNRQSVWSVLESLDAPIHSPISETSRSLGEGGYVGGYEGVDDSGSEVFSDGSSVMMYSPLLPTQSSFVELAESAPVGGSGSGDLIPQEETTTTGMAAWMGMWPFSAWSGGEDRAGLQPAHPSAPSPHPTASSPTSSSPTPPSPSLTSPSPTSTLVALPRDNQPTPGSPRRISSPRPRLQGQTQRVWVPSATELSLQAMWWGYRLYLPPPVLDVLSDTELEATRRAAIITAALTWFFGHLPISLLPPAVRPALQLLQTLVPYVGYIGSFISWIWGTIKSYDAGYGVILTATWLLPVALIPSTWEANAFPPPSPAPRSPQAVLLSSPTPVYAPMSLPMSASPTYVPPTPMPLSQSMSTPSIHSAPIPPTPQSHPLLSPAWSTNRMSSSLTAQPMQLTPSLPSTPAPVLPPTPTSMTPSNLSLPPTPIIRTIPLPAVLEPISPYLPSAPSPPTIPLPEIVSTKQWRGKGKEREVKGKGKENDRLRKVVRMLKSKSGEGGSERA